MKQNIFSKLISSPLMNLDHTYRYSGTKLVEAETLSQHIIDTMMLGIKIIDEINSNTSENLSPEKYIMKALYHDIEEIITGDIPRPLKYHNQNTIDSMREVADEVATKLFREQFKNDWFSHYSLWKTAKEEKEGYILKVVDNLVVINKFMKEVSLLNNYYMLRVGYEVIQYTAELLDHIYDDMRDWSLEATRYINNLLESAVQSVKDILEEHQSIYSYEEFCNNSMK